MVTMELVEAQLPAGWLDRELPPGLEDIGGRDTMASARPYDGPHRDLNIELAPIQSLAGWGLTRPLEVGETIEAVGFLHRDDDHELRVETIWIDGGTPIRQRLLSLPDRPQPATAAPGSPTNAEAAPDDATASTWLTLGGVVIAALIGGGLYLRRSYGSD
jgi:hypothetical protein